MNGMVLKNEIAYGRIEDKETKKCPQLVGRQNWTDAYCCFAIADKKSHM